MWSRLDRSAFTHVNSCEQIIWIVSSSKKCSGTIVTQLSGSGRSLSHEDGDGCTGSDGWEGENISELIR